MSRTIRYVSKQEKERVKKNEKNKRKLKSIADAVKDDTNE